MQVKRVPDDVHAALKRRAIDLGVSLNDLLLAMLKRELGRPSIDQWIGEVRDLGLHREIDIEQLMDEVRGERND